MVTPFDYPGTQWVTDPGVAPKLAGVISCLADHSASNGGPGKVIIVAHSMGGLAVRCAVSAACAGPAAAKPAQVGLEITLGTPNTGSLLATAGNGLSDIGQLSCDTVLAIETGLTALPCPDLLGWLFGANTPAALALQGGVNGNPSRDIASLPALPSTVPLDAIAGQVTVTTSLFQLGTFRIAGPQLGDLGVTVYPPGAGASSPVAIIGSETSACAGCTLDQACRLFPGADKALRSALGEACPARPPGAETVTSVAPGVVAFEDPPGVKGDGQSSGGQYPANGVMTYHPSAPDGSWQETCTLPASEKVVCTAALNTFVSWYGQR